MAADGFEVDDFLPAGVEMAGDFGAGGEDGAEAELDVGLGDDLFEDEAFVDLVPVVGEAAGVEEDDAIAGDAEVFEMGVEGEEAAAPAGLADVEEAVEPEFDFVEALLAGEADEVGVEGGFDASGGFVDGDPAGPAADFDADGGKGDDFGDEGRAFEVLLGEAFAAPVAGAVDAPDVLDVGAEPEAAGDDAHDGLDGEAEGAEGAAGTLEEGLGEELPEPDEGDDFLRFAGAFDDPVVGGVDDLADAFAEPFEAAGGELSGRLEEDSIPRHIVPSPLPYAETAGYASEFQPAKKGHIMPP